jgi:dTDP-4-amino-4,6-dideoxygalactose transaminase
VDRRIYLSPPDVRPAERAALLDALDSGWVAPVGPALATFEEAVAERCGVAHGVGMASGTAALHLALRELGVGPGDDVLVSTFTFAASANAISYLGAHPIFVDSDAATWNMSPALVAEELAARAQRGAIPRAAVVVDLYGNCADYDELLPLFAEYGVTVVEDAAEALGATYRGAPAGSFGAAAVMSFNGNKIITTSGGGMFLTDDAALADRIRYLSRQARQPVVHYEHTEIGFNYGLSNLLAAFGHGQLTTLDDRIARRAEILSVYRKELADVPGLRFLEPNPAGTSNYWLTCVTIDEAEAGVNREDLRLHLESRNIETRPAWKPLHLQPVFAEAARRVDGTSEQIFRDGLCLPSGSSMTDDELARVVDAAREVLLRR